MAKRNWMMYSTFLSNCFIICYVVIFTLGCSKNDTEKKDIAWEVCKNSCNSILQDDRCSQQNKALASKVLSIWSDENIDPMPYLIQASYHKNRKEQFFLTLQMFDEEKDIIGIIIREVDSKKNTLIDEQYPYFIWYPTGTCKLIPFVERKSGDVKNSIAWGQYESSPEMMANRPSMFISIPQADVVDIEIAVYDKKGNKSDFIRLDSFIAGR